MPPLSPKDKNVGRTPWSARDALVPPEPTWGSAADQGVRPTYSPHPADTEPVLFCPVCSLRLTERKCKLYCEQCGYFMSCADYY